MRVLLDENIPHDLIPQFAGHEVSTVRGLGWAGIKNGDLLECARATIDVLVTMVSFPMPDRVAHPARIRVGFERTPVHEDLPVREIRVEYEDQPGRLDHLRHPEVQVRAGREQVPGAER